MVKFGPVQKEQVKGPMNKIGNGPNSRPTQKSHTINDPYFKQIEIQPSDRPKYEI